MSALTSTELISQALKRLGNETLADDADVWLSNILDRLYEDHKWSFLEKTTTGALVASDSSIDLPADFDSPWDVNSFKLIDSTGSEYPLSFSTGYDQDNLTDPSVTGTPYAALLDLNAMTWRPYPLANQAYTYHIRYRYKPDRDTGIYTPVFPNDQILIQAIFVDGLQHEDDDRYPAELGRLEKMIRAYKRKFNTQPIKSQKLRLSSRFGNPGSFR
jgi:hypothetical protein